MDPKLVFKNNCNTVKLNLDGTAQLNLNPKIKYNSRRKGNAPC
uniref:Uncharacterized protein n=1 Tax=Rhizophora mucronata TaxID=61149 RepID=A0A2P2QTA7_RHIMU